MLIYCQQYINLSLDTAWLSHESSPLNKLVQIKLPSCPKKALFINLDVNRNFAVSFSLTNIWLPAQKICEAGVLCNAPSSLASRGCITSPFLLGIQFLSNWNKKCGGKWGWSTVLWQDAVTTPLNVCLNSAAGKCSHVLKFRSNNNEESKGENSQRNL